MQSNWFFRRRSLERADIPEYNNTIIVLIRLQTPTETPTETLTRTLTNLHAALTSAGHEVTGVADWDGKPGHRDEYDYDTEAYAEWREFCCVVARSYLERSSRADARQTARRWLDRHPPWAKRLVHWLCWITGDPDEPARLIECGII